MKAPEQPHRVAEGDGAAVRVGLGGVEAQDLGDRQGLGGEGLVGLDDIHLVQGQTGLFEGHGDAGIGPSPMMWLPTPATA